jgi:recombination protein RecR
MAEPLLDDLVDALRCLPGVGRKSAQRMVWHLLERDREGGQHLAGVLKRVMTEVGHCEMCRNFSMTAICSLCADESRDQQQICVVETPADVIAVEQSGSFKGRYFLTMGNLSPIDGIGPTEIGADALVRLCGEGVIEVILALDSTVEGEATSHYLSEQLQSSGVKVTRIAHGVPMGGTLEYIDGGTLFHAITGRKPV